MDGNQGKMTKIGEDIMMNHPTNKIERHIDHEFASKISTVTEVTIET